MQLTTLYFIKNYLKTNNKADISYFPIDAFCAISKRKDENNLIIINKIFSYKEFNYYNYYRYNNYRIISTIL